MIGILLVCDFGWYFQAYSFAFAGLGQNSHTNWTTQPIPYSGGLESRVILGGVFSGTIRSLIECPLEVISASTNHVDFESFIIVVVNLVSQTVLLTSEVRQMTGQSWQLSQLFSGMGVLWMRATGLMTSFFIMVDYASHYIPEVITYPGIGPFIKGLT
jgi:hypothetical protein